MMQQRGMTLIELVIVLSIVGILAALAYPSYTSYVERTRRGDAQAALMAFAAAMERYALSNGTSGYANAANGSGVPASTVFASSVPLDGGDVTYDLRVLISSGTATCPALSATAYCLRAVPRTGGSMESDSCGTMTLDHRGQRGAAVSTCW